VTLCLRDNNALLGGQVPRWSSYPFPVPMFIVNWLWDVLAQLGMFSTINNGGMLNIRSRFAAQECENPVPRT